MELSLTPLTLEDRPRLERSVALTVQGGQTPLAAWAFPPHYIWQDLFTYRWAELNGWWCLFAEYIDGMFMPLPPLGPSSWVGSPTAGSLSEVVGTVMAYLHARNAGSSVSRIENVPRELTDSLKQEELTVTRKDADYLYRTQDLVGLKGDRFKSPRAAYNRFLRAHRVRYVPYHMADRDACLALLERWIAQKDDRHAPQGQPIDPVARTMLKDAALAHRRALQDYRALGLIGRVVWVDGVIKAYTFGFERSSDVFCILLEVADRTVYGLAQFLFREFCREMQKYPYVNTMDDGGLPSLAKAKRAYHPCRLVENYIATP